ncbi:hypothetical protein M8J76_015896 [Diaphorina citri]|nr:hypothetical protein M8J76_015896 [Diaphorina citri]KAI5731067.1 hypothetical protein M8J77_004080 [Diaphorina citri]
MKVPQYYCVFFVATAGLQGNLLGSDEQEIILLIYVIIDSYVNKIIGTKHYLVKPNSADINENVLSEQLALESSLTDDLVKNGVPLRLVLSQFNEYALSLQIQTKPSEFQLIADGQLPIRQCLHPEACKKKIDLPEYYDQFHDLRKHFRLFYNVPKEQELSTPSDLLNYLSMNYDEDSTYFAESKKMSTFIKPYFSEAKKMVAIVQRLIADGHCFVNPERVNVILEPGIYSKDEEVDNNHVVRVRGLPWQSSDQDIAKFFRGLNVAKGGVALCLSAFGRRNGEAIVRFIDQEHRDMALKRHKHHIDKRYIEVTKANGEDFINVAGGNNNEAQAFLTRGAQVIIRMRGLPYECTAKQVIDFFEAGTENSCNVMDGEEGVLFVKKPDGKATGDAFVLFEKEEEADKALSKHKESIGIRYIELFRSTTAEVQQVLNKTMELPKNNSLTSSNNGLSAQQPMLSHLAQVPVPYLPQHIITSGTRKDCIRLRGLPYEALVEHILEFLGEFASNIVYQGVHMVYNSQGQPSGEAFIQMDSEHSAYLAAQLRHNRNMIFGKKQRYIEVFQCSGEDMNLVLNGVLPPTSPAISPVGKTLLSPGVPMLGPHQFGAPHPPFSHFGAPRLLSPAPNTSFPSHPRAFLYWPYPSPPVSPTMYIMPGNPPPPHQPTHPMHHSIDWNMDFLAPSHPHMSPFPPVPVMGGMYSAAA